MTTSHILQYIGAVKGIACKGAGLREQWGDSWMSRSKFLRTVASRLDAWLCLNEPPKPEKSEPDRFREETRELIEREGKRIRDERNAVVVLEHYVEQDLINCKDNADAIDTSRHC